jgi:hypothetical protein
MPLAAWHHPLGCAASSVNSGGWSGSSRAGYSPPADQTPRGAADGDRCLGSRVPSARHAAGNPVVRRCACIDVKQLSMGVGTKNAPPASCAGGASGKTPGDVRVQCTVPSHPTRFRPVGRRYAGRPSWLSVCRDLSWPIGSCRLAGSAEARPIHEPRRIRSALDVARPRAAVPRRRLLARL